MRRKIVVTVSAMMIAARLGSPLMAAAPSSDQLGEIANYLESNDVQGLRDYLDVNPDLTEGNTTLARLLREFLAESENVGTFLGFKSDLSDSFNEMQEQTRQTGNPSLY